MSYNTNGGHDTTVSCFYHNEVGDVEKLIDQETIRVDNGVRQKKVTQFMIKM